MIKNAAREFQSMAEGLASTGMGLREISRNAGLSPATISRAIHGDCRQPSAESFERLERVWIAKGKPGR